MNLKPRILECLIFYGFDRLRACNLRYNRMSGINKL